MNNKINRNDYINLLIDISKGKEKYIKPWDFRRRSRLNKIPEIEMFIRKYNNDALRKVDFQDGKSAMFFPYRNIITLPPLTAYKFVEEYYRIVFHEIAHSTGTEFRAGEREMPCAKEEIIAEIVSQNLLNDFGLLNSFSKLNSDVYIAGWLYELLIDDKNKYEKEIKSVENEIELCYNYITTIRN